jgi:hypothetical protein
LSESLEDLIEAEAAKNARMSSDAGSVDRRPLADIIAADRYLGSKRAAANSDGLFGIRVKQLVPGSPGE